MTPARKAKLSAPPAKSALLMRPGGKLHVYESVLWGVRLCQAEGRPIDVEMMTGYVEGAMELLRDACAAYAWRARRRVGAR